MHPYPLSRAHRLRLAQAFAGAPRVDISIDCAVEDQMGQAFVDYTDNPQRFMIEQDRFFCYFAGEWTSAAGRDFLAQTPRDRFLMAGTEGWAEAAQQVFGENAIPLSRTSYGADTLSPDRLSRLAAINPHTPNVRRVDAALASIETPYLSIGAFDSPEDFVTRGIGYCLLQGSTMIGCAYSSLVCSHAIEVSIVVDPEHQRRGIATALACQLLKWCLDHHLDPHWDAANEESCRLAEKLGYRRKDTYLAYYLK